MPVNKWIRATLVMLFLVICEHCSPLSAFAERPNVVLIITDDQGYGDLACHGNDIIQTPHMDQLWKESVRLANFHVDPTCAPTRSALMTGRYSSKTGVWHTIMGRSLMHKDEVTIAELFRDAGYQTGMFGKWHLGDNSPCRPQDQGFQEVFMHGGGGVGQTPDFWGNDYFDDTYFRNGRWVKQKGYCTDVWFQGAIDFINKNKQRPFFCYLATNAPHGPYLVSKKYSEPYSQLGVPSPRAEFWGMITNIDENLAKLKKTLCDLKLEENTIFIFMSDNGTAAGTDFRNKKQRGFNAGMRGKKGSEYDGGHRVPCFIKWPAQNIGGGRDVNELTAHIDILPTLMELCGVKNPHHESIDGKSLVPLLKEKASWPHRTLVVHSQRIDHPEKWRKSAVMTDRWRLINGKELYDMKNDPGQADDIAVSNPTIVKKLTQHYEEWYSDISERFDDYVRIEIGSQAENPVKFTAHDWHAPIREVPWNQSIIKQDRAVNGFWAIDVLQAGKYVITLRKRPAHVSFPLNATTAKFKIGDIQQVLKVESKATAVSFTLQLPVGPAFMQTELTDSNGKSRGAYFVDVRHVK